MVNRRLLIVVGKRAQAKLLVCDHSDEATVKFLSSQVCEIFVDDDVDAVFPRRLHLVELRLPDLRRVVGKAPDFRVNRVSQNLNFYMKRKNWISLSLIALGYQRLR